MIALWASLSGAGGVGYQNSDYRAHNALLRDLVVQPWPLRMKIGETVTPVVYYVGYYLPAAAAGKAAGWYTANGVLFLWTVLGALLAFGWFVRVAGVPRDHWPATAIMFCFAGGLDVVGCYLLRHNAFELTRHVDSWAEFFQYSSNTTLMYWVPQHAIAAWLGTGLLLDAARDARSARVVTVAAASAILWSPFGVLGLVPFAILSVAQCFGRELHKWVLSPSGILLQSAAVAVAAVGVAYLAASRFSFPMGLVWEGRPGARVLRVLLAFWFLEFGLLASLVAAFVLVGARALRRRGIEAGRNSAGWFKCATRVMGVDRWQLGVFATSVSVLLLLPNLRMGRYNDLVMRGSIPALFALWTCVAAVLIRQGGQRERGLRELYVAIAAVVAIGGFSAVAAMSRSIQNYHLGPPQIGEVKTTALLPARDVAQRSGRADSFFYRVLAR